MTPSDEQRRIVAAFLAGDNIKLDAVAGAGKSTTLLMCAAAAPGRKCLILTYNKSLELDVKGKISAAGLRNAEIRTYHGAASFVYRRTVNNDTRLLDVVARPPARKIACGVLMLDEVQDMTIAYYLLVRHLLGPDTQVLVAGDPRQAIGAFKGARAEFLLECERLFVTGRPWRTCPLTKSFRLTPATADFVNAHVVGFRLIEGGNAAAAAAPTVYVATRYHGAAARVAGVVSELLERRRPESIAIIAPSVRAIASGNDRNPLVQLVKTHLAGVPVYASTRDDEVLNERLLEGKLAICTWNSMKGRERPCVVVMNFDETYFQYFAQDWPAGRAGLPPVLYVAATRALEELVVVADAGKTLRSVNTAALSRARVVGGPVGPAVRLAYSAGRRQRVSVTELLRYMDAPTQHAMLRAVTVTGARRVRAPERAVDPIARFGGYAEAVACFYGIVVPRLVELELKGSTALGRGCYQPLTVDDDQVPGPYELTARAYAAYPAGYWEAVDRAYETPAAERALRDWFRLAVADYALWEGMHHVARQIRDYAWVDEAFVRSATACVKEALGAAEGEFEVQLPECEPRPGLTLSGRADYIDPAGLCWEFKCAREVTDEHILQLACYLAMLGAKEGRVYAFGSGEILSVRVEDGAALLAAAMEKFDRREHGDIVSDIEAFLLTLRADSDPGDPVQPQDDDSGDDGPEDNPYTLDDLGL